MELLNFYESKLQQLQYSLQHNDNLYKQSYNIYWITNNQSFWKYNNLYEYRQSLYSKIGQLNRWIENYKIMKDRQTKVNTFLQKIYFFIQFNLKQNGC